MNDVRQSAGADPLARRLKSLVRALRRTSRLERAGAAFWPLPIIAIALIGADALWPAHESVRIVCAIAFALLLLRVVWALIVPERAARRAGPARAARIAEERLALQGNPLVNALQLRTLAMSSGDAASALAREAVRRGEETSSAIEARRVIDTSRAGKVWRLSLLTTITLLTVALLSPRLVAMGAMRYLDPMGDHPPYSRTTFDIQLQPDPALVGDDVEITVRTAGPAPDSVRLEIERLGREPGEETVSVGMSARTDGFNATLRDVREPVRIRAVGSTGLSAWLSIEPVHRPRIREATLMLTPPEYTGIPPFTIDPRESIDGQAPELVVGSAVELRVTLSLPVMQADAGADGAEVEWWGRTAIARVQIERPGETPIALSAAAESGLWLDAPVRARVLAIPDSPPSIEVRSPAPPGEAVLAAPGSSVAIRASAHDDHALGAFDLHWTVERSSGGADHGAMSLLPDGFVGASHHARASFDLDAVAAGPGDVIHLSLSAADTRPDAYGGAQRTIADPIAINVVARTDSAFDAQEGDAAADAEALTGADQPEADAADAPSAIPGPEEADAESDSPGREEAPAASPEDETETPADAAATDADIDAGAARLDDGVLIGDPDEAEPQPFDRPSPITLDDVETIRREVDRPVAEALKLNSVGLAGLADLPPAYRDLVSRYFLRIARDDARDQRPETDE